MSAKSLTCDNVACYLLFAKMMDRLHQSASTLFPSRVRTVTRATSISFNLAFTDSDPRKKTFLGGYKVYKQSFKNSFPSSDRTITKCQLSSKYIDMWPCSLPLEVLSLHHPISFATKTLRNMLCIIHRTHFRKYALANELNYALANQCCLAFLSI